MTRPSFEAALVEAVTVLCDLGYGMDVTLDGRTTGADLSMMLAQEYHRRDAERGKITDETIDDYMDMIR